MAEPGSSRLRPIVNRTLAALVAFVMIGGGIAHLAAPQGFVPLVPLFLPALAVIMVTGVFQIAIGLAALWPGTRALGGLCFALLCAGYMPLHLWDYVRPDPVFAPPVAATVRVVIQCLFIWGGLALWRRSRS
ncbi:MAG: hypothetical protein NTX73_10880 [Rhodobacterales bacterium]|nr:hypothetical protein [Rhodobacterales bacterium]